ncbi:MAG: glycosyltransferase [Elusimicrobia bacterium]|nr:glycosyltransferase [Elusimicrobiota bacterium]
MNQKERIRVLYLMQDLSPFGAQRIALYTVRSLRKDIFHVTVCPFGSDDTLAPEFAAAGAEIVPLRGRFYPDVFAWFRLVRLLFSGKYDIAHTCQPRLSMPLRLLTLFIPRLQIVHAVNNPFSSEPWYVRWPDLFTMPLCSALAFSSNGLMTRELRERGQLYARPVAIPDGVEPASGDGGLRGELGIAPGEKVVCCAAQLTRQKGQDILIKASADLKRRGRDIRLLLAGDGRDMGRLKYLAVSLDVSDRVIFLGKRTDVGRVLAASDVYASGSRWESFDLALGEAMLAGLPCAATEIPGHEDLLLDGETGIAVPPWSPGAMASAIEWLLSRPDEAARLGTAAKALIRREYSTAAMAEKYRRLYMETVAKNY